MNSPEKRIIDFIKKHQVLTIATSENNKPYCANCFYAYLENENAFVFTSDIDTRHIQEAIKQPDVAGSVVLETRLVGKIQGIQFTGKLIKAESEFLKTAQIAYLKRFPFAILMKTTLWVLSLNFIKMTDNRLGFGKKLIWQDFQEG
jgi:uncharacterized protein YhbP (UPF0306 family)